MTLPLSHAYGLLVTVTGFHSVERDLVVLLRRFDPGAFLDAIEEHRLQQTAVVPTMLQALLAQPLEDRDLSTLQQVTSGASPLSPETEHQFTRRVPSASIRQGYGLTESAALVSSNPAGRVRSGSVGLPCPAARSRSAIRTIGRCRSARQVRSACARRA